MKSTTDLVVELEHLEFQLMNEEKILALLERQLSEEGYGCSESCGGCDEEHCHTYEFVDGPLDGELGCAGANHTVKSYWHKNFLYVYERQGDKFHLVAAGRRDKNFVNRVRCRRRRR